jgi:predicted dehydrogenase
MRATNWGIIGPGNIARTFANDLQLISAPQPVKAVLGHHADTTEQFAEEFDVMGCYTDLDKFLEHDNLQAVYIASPHPQHFDQALACLEKKVAVLCEKPMTINAGQTRMLVAMANRKNTFLMEGMWIRFLPSIKLVLSLIQQGRIGNVISVRASMGFKAPCDPSNRYFDPAQGGGSLLDLGIYPVFLACLLMGRPDDVKAVGTLTSQGVDEYCSMSFHYSSGQHAVLESTLLDQPDLPAEITGEKGTIRILNPWFEKTKGIELNQLEEGNTIYPCEWEGHGLQFEAEEVIHCLQQNKIESEHLSHAFSLEVMEVMDEIRRQVNVTYDMYE